MAIHAYTYSIPLPYACTFTCTYIQTQTHKNLVPVALLDSLVLAVWLVEHVDVLPDLMIVRLVETLCIEYSCVSSTEEGCGGGRSERGRKRGRREGGGRG